MIDVVLHIHEYSTGLGVTLNWEADSIIKTKIEDGATTISANGAGLASLANHFAALAQEKAPTGSHIHLDDPFGLEKGSTELIIAKI